MKNSLLFSFTVVLLLSICFGISGKAQTVFFSENFSGFSTNSHTTPSTSDASANLDSKTQLPGWTGFKVYSAGGEIKLGTSDIAGWIETPLITFSGNEGILTLKFDICRWTGDATSVQILLNGTQIGNTLSPTDGFQTIEIPVTPGVTSGKIKFEALSKRFFLDNVMIVSQNTTHTGNSIQESEDVVIFPNPAIDFVTIDHVGGYKILEVLDLNGRVCLTKSLAGEEKTDIYLADFPAGIYFLRLSSGKKFFTGWLVKLQ
jgi:hypothetical protein